MRHLAIAVACCLAAASASAADIQSTPVRATRWQAFNRSDWLRKPIAADVDATMDFWRMAWRSWVARSRVSRRAMRSSRPIIVRFGRAGGA